MLYKNAFKLLKKKKFQLLAIGIIIFLSSFIYVAMYNAMNTIEDTLDKYIKETNQEDFVVNINDYALSSEVNLNNNLVKLTDLKISDSQKFNQIMDNRINDFKKQYEDTDLEVRYSKDILFKHNSEAYKMRLLKDAKKINLSYIESGRKPEKDNEIAFPKIFLENNNLKLDDEIIINDKKYRIVGEVLFPDYTLLIFGKEFIIDSKKITVALTTDNEYEKLKGIEKICFSGKISKDVKDFKEYFNKDLPYVESIIDTESNITSGYLFKEVVMGKTVVVGLSIMITGIAIVIVGIILYKILQGEKGPIGVLKALGYLNKEIAKPYIMIIALVALPMLILGSIVGYFMSKSTLKLFAEFYLFPQENIVNDFSVYIFSVVIPFVFFIGLSYLIIKFMIRKKPLDLLKPNSDKKLTKLTVFVDKLLGRCKTVTKFKYSFLIREKGKFIVYILGVMFASSLIILGLMMPRFFTKFITDSYEKVDYKYQAYIDVSKPLPDVENGQEKFIIISTEVDNHNVVLSGLESDNKLYKLYNDDNEEITSKLQDGVIVTESFKGILDKDIGDEITLDLNGKKMTFSIVGVSEEYKDATVYMERETLSEIYTNGQSKDIFTGVYSEDKMDESKYSSIVTKNDILEQSKSMQGFLYVCIGVMLGVSILIAIIILFVLTSITIEDNYYNISLLKVMGYNKKEVNSMIINSYLAYAMIAYFIALPISVFGIDAFINYIGKGFDMVLPFKFELWQIFVGVASIIIIYFIGTINAKRKVNKISLQETLKAYRE
ncbi:MAG: ABC transporter permease [Clostridium sp.]|nr:ABC transporter permease [Clostridium sp.]